MTPVTPSSSASPVTVASPATSPPQHWKASADLRPTSCAQESETRTVLGAPDTQTVTVEPLGEKAHHRLEAIARPGTAVRALDAWPTSGGRDEGDFASAGPSARRTDTASRGLFGIEAGAT